MQPLAVWAPSCGLSVAAGCVLRCSVLVGEEGEERGEEEGDG